MFSVCILFCIGPRIPYVKQNLCPRHCTHHFYETHHLFIKRSLVYPDHLMCGASEIQIYYIAQSTKLPCKAILLGNTVIYQDIRDLSAEHIPLKSSQNLYLFRMFENQESRFTHMQVLKKKQYLEI